MNPIYQIERAACLRRLNDSLIHIEGWGMRLKTMKDVEEYRANVVEKIAEIENLSQSFKNNFLVLSVYMIFNHTELKVNNVSLLDVMNNNYLGMSCYALRSYKKELAILDAWLKASKSFFK